jgi:P27 family predicted phage terminase small subunit
MAGRKPKPTALKILQGNPSKRPLNKNEPKFDSVATKPPENLDDVGIKEWNRIVPSLEQAGVLKDVDIMAIAGYCEHFSRWHNATKEIHKKGYIIKSPSGYPVNNPYIGIANTSFMSMMKVMAEFGMTASSRAKISIADKVDAVDPFEKFLNAK